MADHSRDAGRVRGAYDAHPWPSPGMVQGPALPDFWVDAAAPEPVLVPGKRILVAGCGAGGEVAYWQNRVPRATVDGVDFSHRSIEAARLLRPHASLEVVDLAQPDSLVDRAPYDFISCHAVADYVPEIGVLMRNLSGVLAPGGVLYVGTNSEHHHRTSVRRVLDGLGLPSDVWQESPTHRSALRIFDALLGGKPGMTVSDQPEAMLKADALPAFAHSVSLGQWCSWASEAGLSLAATTSPMWVMPNIGDSDLSMLFGVSRAELSRWVEARQQNPVLQMLFVREPLVDPPWTEPLRLKDWRVRVASQLALSQMPPLSGDWMAIRQVTLGYPGLRELHLSLSAWLIEFLRRCDGTKDCATIRASMSSPCHDDHLGNGLYRLWQVGLIRLVPPEAD